MGLLSNRRRYSKPYDYEVEYLEVTRQSGIVYIDTLYIPKGLDNEIYAKFMPTETLADNSVWFNTLDVSVDDINNSRVWRVIQSKNGQIYVCNMSSNSVQTLINAPLNQIHEIELLPDKIVLNGKSYGNSLVASVENKSSMMIFNGHSKKVQIAGRIYYFRIKKAGVTVLDLIPVVKNGVGYMYDKVSHKLFGAQGGGEFIVEPKIN